MYLSYTFISGALNAETTLTVIMPDMHDAPSKRGRLPALVLVGDKGVESSWWLRSLCPENLLDKAEERCALIAVRNEGTQAMLPFLCDELPRVLCGRLPIDAGGLGIFGYGDGALLAERAGKIFGAYRKVYMVNGKESKHEQ